MPRATTWSDFIDQNTGLIISGCFSILSFIVAGVANLSILRPIRAYKKHRETLLQEWNEDNPQYGKTKSDRDAVIDEIEILKSQIKDLKNEI